MKANDLYVAQDLYEPNFIVVSCGRKFYPRPDCVLFLEKEEMKKFIKKLQKSVDNFERRLGLER